MSEPGPSAERPIDDLTTRRVRGALRGEAPSVEWVVRRFGPWLRAQAEVRLDARLRTWVEPDDVVHQVWLRALPRLAEFSVRGARATPAFLAFLSRILLNETNSLYRKRIRGEPVSIDDADLGPEVAPEVAETVRAASRLARDETRDEVGRALAGLSPEDRELVVLRGVEQHPPRDLARLLGVRPNTISARYRRALEKLRRLLPPDLVADLADDGGPNERAGEPTAEPPGEPPGE